MADKWRRDYRDATSLHSSGVRRQARASRFCGREWNENRIKQPTGGDPLTARFMRQDLFTFMPTHKLFIVGNNQPNLTKVDDAARRRFQMIPSEDRLARQTDCAKTSRRVSCHSALDDRRSWALRALMLAASCRSGGTIDENQEALRGWRNNPSDGWWLRDECLNASWFRNLADAKLAKRLMSGAKITRFSQSRFSMRMR